MTPSVYTLLVVESPVIARIIQQHAPSSVYVISSGGYSWKPVYDEKKNKLKAVADPDKREFRNELKEQAKWAGNIVVATDSDPSGDFIAWSIFRFLKTPSMKRAQLHHFGKTGITRLLQSAEIIQDNALETRLRNRLLIRSAWKRNPYLPPPEIAGLSSLFGRRIPYRYFSDDENRLLRVNTPLQCPPDEWLHITLNPNSEEYHSFSPLSTFDVLEQAVDCGVADSFTEAQQALQELFTTPLQYSDEFLISYPRTAANSFYSETWTAIQQQYLSFGSRNRMKPPFAQNIAGSNVAHESIYPLNLSHKPERIRGELSQQSGDLYSLIYRETLKAIEMPEPVDRLYTTAMHPGHQFYNPHRGMDNRSLNLLPVRTAAEIGSRLSSRELISPSSFGMKADRWFNENYLQKSGHQVQPGKRLLPYLKNADRYAVLLSELFKYRNSVDLTPETIRSVIS